MPLKVKDGMGAWIDDFKKSDAPQFKGKSDKERRDQAIAAYLSAKRGGETQKENGDLSYEGPKKIPASIVKKLKSLNLKVDQDDDDDDMKKEEIERRADFEITKKTMPNGFTKFVKKPRKEIEIGKGKMEANQKSVEVDEAVKVDKKDYSWGRMVTVSHGNSHSFPLHPEHQNAIKKLKDGESTKFKDETGSHITATRKGNDVHLKHPRVNKVTKVAHSHFAEQDGPPWDGPSKTVKGPTDFHAMRAKVKSLAVKGMNQAGKKPGVKKNG